MNIAPVLHKAPLKSLDEKMNDLPFGAMDSSANHQFNFNEAISFIITVDTQDEIDHYWNILADGGKPGRCGWIKD